MNKAANGDEYIFRTSEDWGTITGALVPSKDRGVEYRKIDPESGELKITRSKMFTHPDGTEFKSAKELLDYVDTLRKDKMTTYKTKIGTINIECREHDFVAMISDRKTRWGCGKSQLEAIGDLLITHFLDDCGCDKMFTHPDGTEFKSAKGLLDYVDTLKMRQRIAKEERDMPCFFCKAFGDDEQCLINRHSVSKEGIEGLDCPRIQKAIDEQKQHNHTDDRVVRPVIRTRR